MPCLWHARSVPTMASAAVPAGAGRPGRSPAQAAQRRQPPAQFYDGASQCSGGERDNVGEAKGPRITINPVGERRQYSGSDRNLQTSLEHVLAYLEQLCYTSNATIRTHTQGT